MRKSIIQVACQRRQMLSKRYFVTLLIYGARFHPGCVTHYGCCGCKADYKWLFGGCDSDGPERASCEAEERFMAHIKAFQILECANQRAGE